MEEVQVIKGLISRNVFVFHLSKYLYSNKSRDGGITFRSNYVWNFTAHSRTKQIYVSLCFTRLLQLMRWNWTMWLNGAVYRTGGNRTGGLWVMRLSLNLTHLYRQFVDKNLKQYLIFVYQFSSMSESCKKLFITHFLTRDNLYIIWGNVSPCFLLQFSVNSFYYRRIVNP